jgi:nucleotide-binding universal stress UspA family protein
MKVPPTNDTLTDSLSIKKIVVAVDLSPHSEVTARYAAEIARSFGASVVLVHVYPVEQVNDFLIEADYEAREGARQAAEQALADLAESLRESYRPCEAAFLVGEPAAQVASVAGDLGADLVLQL